MIGEAGSLYHSLHTIQWQGNANREVGINHLGPYTGSHHGLSYGKTLNGFAMPVRNAEIKRTTLAAHKQLSFENLLAAWLLSDGWEVLVPAIDHGMKTDLVVADDNRFYRIQVKSLQSHSEDVTVENKWSGVKIDYVVYFSVEGEWGYIAPAFSEDRRALKSPGHIRFHKHPTNFLKAFRKI